MVKNEYYLINLHKEDARDIVKEVNTDIYEEYNIHSGGIQRYVAIIKC